jgi:hypothetical protein
MAKKKPLAVEETKDGGEVEAPPEARKRGRTKDGPSAAGESSAPTKGGEESKTTDSKNLEGKIYIMRARVEAVAGKGGSTR